MQVPMTDISSGPHEDLKSIVRRHVLISFLSNIISLEHDLIFLSTLGNMPSSIEKTD